MFYDLEFSFDEEHETIKTEIEDKEKSILIYLSIYMIGGKWYLDIYSDTKEYELGKLIVCKTDLFNIAKANNHEFPNVELRALAVNEIGETSDFSFLSTLLGLHRLFLVTKEEEYE